MTDYLTQGKELLEGGQIKEAIALFQQATTADPTSPWPYCYLGMAFKQDGQLESAVDAYLKSISIDDYVVWNHQNLGEVFLKLGRLEDAVGEFKKAIELRPDLSWAYHHLGETLYKLGKYDEAINYLEKAIELNPDFSWSYYFLGEALTNQLAYDEAIKVLKKAIELNSESEIINNSLATALQKRRELDLSELISTYKKAIENNPNEIKLYQELLELDENNWEIWGKLGQVLINQNQFDEGIKCLHKAIEINPNSYDIYQNIGDVLVEQERWDEAIEFYLSVLENNPDNFSAHHKIGQLLKNLRNPKYWQLVTNQYEKILENFSNSNILLNHFLGDIFSHQNQWEKAAYYYQNAIEINVNYFWSQKNLGDALKALSRDEEATMAYLSAVICNPESFETHQLVAQQLRKLENSEYLDKAILAYQNKIEESPNCLWLYHFLGDIFMQSKEWEKAIIPYQNAIKINPNHFWSHHNLGNAFRYLNKNDEASLAYRNALDITPFGDTYFYLGMILAGKREIDDAYYCYIKAQEMPSDQRDIYYQLGSKIAQVCHQIGLEKSQEGLLDEAVNYFQKATKAHVSNYELTYQTLWKELNFLSFGNQIEELDTTTEIKPEMAYTYFSKTSQYKIINFWSLTDTDRDYLNQVGISLKILELINQDKKSLEEIYINNFSGEKFIKLTEKHERQTLWHESTFGQGRYFHQSLVETGYVYSICPYSGKIIRSNQSFYDVAWLPMFSYRFVGLEVFYLLVGHYWAGKQGIYFPRLELIIVFSPHHIHGGYKQVIDRLKGNMVSCWQLAKSYISNNDVKKTALVIGQLNQIAHYLWNDLTGIYYLYENNILNHVEKLFVQNDFFGIDSLFPEMKEKIDYLSDNSMFPNGLTIFQDILKNNYLAGRVADLIIKNSLTTKLREISEKKCSPIFLQRINQIKQNFPIVWFGLRVHNRVWLSQTESIANIINRIQADFPNLAVIFAGCSRKETKDDYWESIIEREMEIYQKIIKLIPNNISTYNAIGSQTYETLVCAQTIDFYITPLSSGLMFPVWVAHKPGVSYGVKCMYNEDNMTQYSPGVAENAIRPVFIDPEHILEDIENPHADIRDYDVDWMLIYNKIIELIKSIKTHN